MPDLFTAPDGHTVQLLHRAVDEQKRPCVVYRRWPDGLGVFVCSKATWAKGFKQADVENLSIGSEECQ